MGKATFKGTCPDPPTLPSCNLPEKVPCGSQLAFGGVSVSEDSVAQLLTFAAPRTSGARRAGKKAQECRSGCHPSAEPAGITRAHWCSLPLVHRTRHTPTTAQCALLAGLGLSSVHLSLFCAAGRGRGTLRPLTAPSPFETKDSVGRTAAARAPCPPLVSRKVCRIENAQQYVGEETPPNATPPPCRTHSQQHKVSRWTCLAELDAAGGAAQGPCPSWGPPPQPHNKATGALQSNRFLLHGISSPINPFLLKEKVIFHRSSSAIGYFVEKIKHDYH